jgi:hypothetical protein
MASVTEVMEDIARYLRKLEQTHPGGYPGVRNEPMVLGNTVSQSNWCVHRDGGAERVRDAIERGIQNGYVAVEKHPECGNLVLTARGREFADGLLEQDEKGKAGFRKP